MAKNFDAVVIGAGVFGAWTAWHLQRTGLGVLLVDQYGPANARASSGGETRVIRMAYGPDEIYTRMSQQSLVSWREFFTRIGQPGLFRETGVLWLSADGNAAATQSLAVLARCGVRHEVLQADALARRYPQLTVPPGGWAILEPDSGGLLARRAVQAVVADSLRAGAESRVATVLAPRGEGRLAEVTTAAGDVIRAGQFVFACGPWLGRVLPEPLGGRIFPTRQEVLYFGAPAGDERFASPALPIWLDFGRDYYGFPDLDGRGFKVAHDSHGEAVDPDGLERVPTPARIAHAREFLARRFPALAAAPLVGAEVCQYENSSNGDFVIDRHPAFDNVWIAGGGSGHGFKHGPAVGAYLAARMLADAPAEPRFGLATKRREQKREVH
jgi:sarcosine oxidase